MRKPFLNLLICAIAISSLNSLSAFAQTADSNLLAQEDSKLRESIDPASAQGESSDSAGGTTRKAQNPDSDNENKLPQAKTPPPPGANASWPARMASFATCSVLGYPFAFARRTYTQTRQGSKDLIGESHNPVLVGFTTALSFPYALIGGIIEGGEYSVTNSWRGSKDEPFGKEAFSLGEMD